MELNTTEQHYELKFNGTGGKLFSVLIVNWILTAITFGLYYPWAKANKLKYLYESTTFNNDEFEFRGTGREMFIGFIKAIVLFGIIGFVVYSLIESGMILAGILTFYLSFLAIVPLAIHGSYRYRLSRSSWRGIRFRYDGNRNIFILNFFRDLFFTIISLGVYGAWFTVNVRSYLIGKIRLGNLHLRYEADGLRYFIINFRGYLLTLITFGIYSFWWIKDSFAFYVDNLSAEKDGKTIRFRSTMSAGDVFELVVINYLILIFTLGIGYAWVVTRVMRFVFSKIEIMGDVNLDELVQDADSFNDASGDDVSDFLDIDFII